MRLNALFAFLRSGQFRLSQRLARIINPFYRAAFLSAAASCGLLTRLAAGPVPLERLAAELAPEAPTPEALEAWLQVGVRLGELQLVPEGYTLRSPLARQLADPQNDAWAAFLQETTDLHYQLLHRLPHRLKVNRQFTLADQDGELIARSSRLLEPLVFAAIDAVLPQGGPLRLLEVGCGSGTYMRHAARRNPQLQVLGVELQPQVAEAARRNLRAWELADRVAVEVGDIRSRPPTQHFDMVTLHNNIYYFPVNSRPGLLAFLRGFLKPGGRLLITTGCRGGSPMMALLDLWGAATAGCGRLPTPREMKQQLGQAGYHRISATRLYPMDTYYSFQAWA